MKKLYTLAVAALVASSAYGQRQVGEVAKTMEAVHVPGAASGAEVVDTVGPSIRCQSFTLYTVQNNGGYVTGTNSYGDKEKGTLFYSATPVTVNSVLPAFALKSNNVGGSLRARVYSIDTTATTYHDFFNEVAVSSPVSIANVDTSTSSLALTDFSFPTPPVVSGFYGVSVEVANGGDVVAMWSTTDTCGFGLAFEKWDNDSIYNLSAAWGGLDLELYMFVVTDNTVGAEENSLNSSSVNVYPNPANARLMVSFEAFRNENVEVAVMDIQGRVVMTESHNANSGRNEIELNTEALSNGAYFYNITVGGQTINGKFVVRH